MSLTNITHAEIRDETTETVVAAVDTGNSIKFVVNRRSTLTNLSTGLDFDDIDQIRDLKIVLSEFIEKYDNLTQEG